MANHGFITVKKKLVKDVVLQDLQEINARRFDGEIKNINPAFYNSIIIAEKKNIPKGFKIF